LEFKDYNKYKNEAGIYSIYCKGNDKLYIGKTDQSFKRRFWHHQWKLEHNEHDNAYLQASFNKYGADSLIFGILYLKKDNDDLSQLEQEYIKQYDTYNNGFNLTTGGDGTLGCVRDKEFYKQLGEKNRQRMLGSKLSEETKQKMRASSKHLSPTEENKQALSIYMSNRVVSDITRQKIREQNLGSKSKFAKLNEEQVLNIKKELLNGTSKKVLSEKYNVSFGAISSIANNRSWTHIKIDGWEEYMNKKKPKHFLTQEEINRAKQMIAEGVSCSEIARQLKCYSSTINNIKAGKYHKD